jgi:hypothetical protein
MLLRWMRSHTPGVNASIPIFPNQQMDEEGVPSTTLREISLLKMLSSSNHIVK